MPKFPLKCPIIQKEGVIRAEAEEALLECDCNALRVSSSSPLSPDHNDLLAVVPLHHLASVTEEKFGQRFKKHFVRPKGWLCARAVAEHFGAESWRHGGTGTGSVRSDCLFHTNEGRIGQKPGEEKVRIIQEMAEQICQHLAQCFQFVYREALSGLEEEGREGTEEDQGQGADRLAGE